MLYNYRKMKESVVLKIFAVLLCLIYTSCTKSTHTVPSPSLSMHIKKADTARKKAEQLMNQKHFEAAKLYFEQAISEYQKSRKHRIELLNCYINIGNCYLELKDSNRSEQYLDKAMKMAFKIKDYNDFRLAQSFKQLAKSYYMKRNFQAAINHYENVLQIVNRLYGENHIETARIYNTLSQIYFNIGDKKTAQIYNDKSLGIKLRGRIRKLRAEKRNSNIESYTEAYGVVHNKVATIHHKKGLVELFKGNHDEALSMFHKALSIYSSLEKENPEAMAELYLDTAKCYHAKNNAKDATHYLNLIKNLIKKKKGFIFKRRAEVEYRLALISLNQSEYYEALKLLQSALILSSERFSSEDFRNNPDLKSLSNDNILLNILFTKADILRQLYIQANEISYLISSNRTFRLIIEHIYNIRNKNYSSSHRHIFNTRCTPIYKRAIATTLRLYRLTGSKKYLKDAITYTEAGKAAILTDMIFESGSNNSSSIPVELRKKERDLYYKLNTFNLFLSKSKTKQLASDSECERVVKFRRMYHSLLLEHTALVNFLDKQYSAKIDRQLNFSLPDAEELMKKTDKDSAILEYYLSGRKLIVFIITANEINIHSSTLKENLNSKVKKFCSSIRKIDEKEYLLHASDLGNILINPLMKWIANKKNLIIIPHGELFKVPFEAVLLPGTGKKDFTQLNYLIRKYSVKYNYSAQLWARSSGVNMADLSFTGYAPVFKGGKCLKSDNSLTGTSEEIYPELPNTEKEVKGIIDLFRNSGKKAEGFFNISATENNFRNNISKNTNQIIHIASHSINNNRNPLFSGILFNSEESSSADDNILYTAEIFNLKLNPALLVLSSCDSGAGELIENEGIAGINRAFIYSGARNVVFSFWKVDDKSTSEIMIEFYKSLLKSTSFTESLRAAKLKMIKNQFTSFPKYWSSFVIISGS